MISPELLRRYPFFGFMNDAQLRRVVMSSEEVTLDAGDSLFEPDQKADWLYVLIEGGLDLVYVVIDRDDPRLKKEFFLGELDPGDIVGLSALVEPNLYTTAARATKISRLVKIEAAVLRDMCQDDSSLAYGLMRETAKTAMARLHESRVLLAAARA